MNLDSIQIGRPETRIDPDREWTTGFFKTPISGAIEVGPLGLVGDGQADLVNHGGVDKAICVYSGDHYPLWQSETGLPMTAGAFGENFTVSRASEADVCIGDVFAIGGVHLQVSQPRQPCWKLGQRWRLKALPKRTIQSGRTGWYVRVLRGGALDAPSVLQRLEHPFPEWTIERANAVFYDRKNHRDEGNALADCPALAMSWRDALR